MQRIVTSIVGLFVSACLWAVPAYRGWQTKTQPDGTTIEVRLVGDEFYSYWETKDGLIAIEQKDGKFVKSREPIPSSEQIRARRANGMNLHAPKVIGIKNLPPKGVVILVNFSDSVMKQGHDSTMFDNMCNATEGNCNTNVYKGVNYGSAAQFFADQSKGTYRPQFDIFGPVTLPHPVAYYGEEGWHEPLQRTEHDLYMGDFVVDALLAADSAGCDFSQYDSNNDNIVDFVYFIYAGQGQADGGESWTIWPHNFYLESLLYYNFTHGQRDDFYWDEQRGRHLPVLDGKEINNYACSAELDSYKGLSGIGTLCHEFGHVMGLPDYYDTKYGVNDNASIYPKEWDIMASGNYNGEGHCPPNYNPWSKYFFGWLDPVNPGRDSAAITLYPNGSANSNVYQINESGEKQDVLTPGVNYFVEYRQQTGWDAFTPAAGMAIWRCDYDSVTWRKNVVNNTAGEPRLNLVCSSGIVIGESNAQGNVFPNGTVDSWTDGKGNQLSAITQNENTVTCRFDYDTAMIVKPKWTDWAYYDDGNDLTSLGVKDSSIKFYWGIKFPANTLAHDTLTKVSIYEEASENTQPIIIHVFSGGIIPIENNLIYIDTVNPAGVNGWHEITLAEPVPFDPQSNLWIILREDGDIHPAFASAHNGTRHTSWLSLNGYIWNEMIYSDGMLYDWMIRAYIGASEEPKGLEDIHSDVNTVKILQNGQLLIIRDGKTYNVLGTKLGN